jgi:hypothetical protein
VRRWEWVLWAAVVALLLSTVVILYGAEIQSWFVAKTADLPL